MGSSLGSPVPLHFNEGSLGRQRAGPAKKIYSANFTEQLNQDGDEARCILMRNFITNVFFFLCKVFSLSPLACFLTKGDESLRSGFGNRN